MCCKWNVFILFTLVFHTFSASLRKQQTKQRKDKLLFSDYTLQQSFRVFSVWVLHNKPQWFIYILHFVSKFILRRWGQRTLRIRLLQTFIRVPLIKYLELIFFLWGRGGADETALIILPSAHICASRLIKTRCSIWNSKSFYLIGVWQWKQQNCTPRGTIY